MVDFGQENVLKHVVAAFAETVALKVKQLRRYVPKQKDLTNTDLTGAFIEELVRGFVRGWIGHKELLHGTFYYDKHVASGQKPLQIDGIVYDPTRGPATIREGDFIVVHPAFCAGVIEIKMSVSSTHDLEWRLWEIQSRYLGHLPTPQVMGIVIADKDPQKASQYPRTSGGFIELYNYRTVPICPIFVLFKETDDGDYEPFLPAIECMIRAIHTNLYVITNYM